ncbi:Mdm33 family-domain-containing protein [Boeremia exigua]|uniref:Mdm33 family-domain-containing protein n=1 Tax=Boeremia exigua TaxID=749465 RepID=UPI001E8DD992|nr:Mdm33 family-domain-containing protein [Boeremia exigua]KAH6614086.1 Mdm33 family-domain-containing protein [Boeremia exigua]
MRPLLQHASRFHNANAATITNSIRPFGRFVTQSPLVCVTQQASTASRRIEGPQIGNHVLARRGYRLFSSSARWKEEKRPPSSSDPIAMPPPATEQKPTPASSVDRTPEQLIERQERLRREWEEQQRKREEEALRKKQQEEEARRKREEEEALRKKREEEALKKRQEEEAARKRQEQDSLRKRVPDEQLPSHQERQRSNLEKRFTALMDDLLPKIAVVTQKVNTFTGTDYSGVEALRREIQEQEKLVKARRLAIDSTKEALDAALEQQATSQKEVVALLERKHSWSSSDLERYMSLIRSEHINDKAVREAKEAVEAAETSLEEARSYLEKRERAQYHEEQIWSDTIRRNSTWVTFGLMGVNIFLLLLSLLILEPWRRRRMVREIKTALEAHKAATETGLTPTSTTAYIAPNPVTEPSASQPEALTDKSIDPTGPHAPTALPVVREPSTEESPTAGTEIPLRIADEDGIQIGNVIEEAVEPAIDPVVSSAASLLPETTETLPQEAVDVQEEDRKPLSRSETMWAKLDLWQSKAVVIAEDIVSDRPISMRRVDFTTAVLQGAAAGAVVAAAAIALLLRPH